MSSTSLTDADRYESFRSALVDAGLLLPLGTDGLYGRSGVLEGVIDGIAAMVCRLAANDGAALVRFPPVIPRWVFERTDYLRSFPDLTGAVRTFTGNDRDHARLLAEAEAGGDWSELLSPSDVMLCPAACHPLYPTLTGTLPAGGQRFDVQGWCFRHEPAIDPARLQAFRQHEIVFVGEADAARAHRDRWVERGASALSDLGLDVRAEAANDPFFGRVGRMLAANQRDENLKTELVAEVASPETLTAILSSNCHLDHFGAPFDILTADGDVAHSACVGFGLERICLALFSRHGLDVDRWPSEVRGRLWP